MEDIVRKIEELKSLREELEGATLAGLDYIESIPENLASVQAERENLTFERTWKDAKIAPPKESGRYWCIVEEVNDLGKSQYQWNCSYNKGEGVWYGENWKLAKVVFWTELAPYPL